MYIIELILYAYSFWYNVTFNFQLKVKIALDLGYLGFSTNKNDIKIALYSVCVIKEKMNSAT